MKKIATLVLFLLASKNFYAQIYLAKACEISFFSETPLENIDAINKTTKPILNTATGDLQMKISMKAFVFPKPLMQEHFNENYVESEKFPDAFFKGKINEQIDYTKDGEYKTTATGKITLHGVEKEVTLEGTITIKEGKLQMQSSFKLHIADYNIKVPSLYVKNIAEDVVVKLNSTLEPFKK